MVGCSAPKCINSSSNSDCSFYRFPNDAKESKKWLRLMRREDFVPRGSSRLCSWHFPYGKGAGPTRFDWNKNVVHHKSPSPKKKRKVEDTVHKLEEDRNKLKERCEILEEKVLSLEKSRGQISYLFLKDNDAAIQMYTGLPSSRHLEVLANMLKRFEISGDGWTPNQLPIEDQLFIVLSKFKLNMPNLDLALRFGKSRTTIAKIIETMVDVLHEILVKGLMRIPSREKNAESLPPEFENFQSCRIILDCTEIEVAKPTKMSEQNLTYSNYKSRNTLKALIGIAPNGFITYCSPLYPGSTSDKAIVQDTEILKLMVPGDMVMADKGFLLYDIMPPGVSLNIPPFLRRAQFTQAEVVSTANIARARIHVERAIQRIKNNRITSFVSQWNRDRASKIFQICSSLTNFQEPIINMHK